MKKVEFEGFTCFTFNTNVTHSPLSDSFNRLVLESPSFPDYYARNHFPPNQKHYADRHLYLLVKEQMGCFQDVVLRNAYILREKQNVAIKAFPGQIRLHQQLYQCIRINVKDIKELSLLISAFESGGIKFLKDKKFADEYTHVVFKKFIQYEKLDEGVFRDFHNENRYFFSAPHLLEFEKFTTVMDQIKRSCDYNLFDSFLSDLFIREEVVDFIGVYSDHCDHNRFGDLKEEIRKRFI